MFEKTHDGYIPGSSRVYLLRSTPLGDCELKASFLRMKRESLHAEQNGVTYVLGVYVCMVRAAARPHHFFRPQVLVSPGRTCVWVVLVCESWETNSA